MTGPLPECSTIVSWDWDFGDGTTGVGEFPNHTFPASGRYTVTLTVTTDTGVVGTVSHEVTVFAPVTNLQPANRRVIRRRATPIRVFYR